MSIEGYCSATSVFPGEEIGFHASSSVRSDVEISIRRLPSEEILESATATVDAHPIPPDSHQRGCGWPPFYTLRVPQDWPSGVYRVDLKGSEEAESRSGDAASQEAEDLRAIPGGPALHFVVKGREAASPRLFSLALTTYQAYNHWPADAWPGGSLYFSDAPQRSHKVSFERPGGWFFFYRWEEPFIRWLEAEGLSVDFCTSVDLHRDPDLLGRYQFLLSVGHDEYWSKEMRDHVEGFIARGGNVAFFSADVCQWQIRLEDDCKTIVCYKNAVEDPLNGIENERVTVEWQNPPVNRPENTMTGVSFRNGAGHGFGIECDQKREEAAYYVQFPKHWIFDGVKLDADRTFGRGENIVGYETDAAHFVEIDGVPRATGREGTPESFVILASADLTNWRHCGKGGYATMGIYRRNGSVFTAATTDWSFGFAHPDSAVHQITRNVVSRLSRPTSSDWELAGAAEGVTAMTAIEGKLFASSKDGVFWWREPTGQNVRWRRIGPTEELVALGSTEEISGRLFGITREGRLQWREPVVDAAPWHPIDDVEIDVVGLAGMNWRLFAVAADGLWWREPMIDEKLKWERIDDAPGVVAMTAIRGALFAVTQGGTLLWRPTAGPEILVFTGAETTEGGDPIAKREWRPTSRTGTPWEEMGPAPEGIVALAANKGQLYAATRSGELWWRDAS